MNYCNKCGSEIDSVKFCPNCGTPVEGSKQNGAPIRQSSTQSENKKRGIKEWLSHPLVLLIAGAIITSILIPQMTSLWQVNEKELDLKFNLADQIINPLHDFVFTLGVYDGVYNLEPDDGVFNDTYKDIVFNDLDRSKVEWSSTCDEMEITLKIYYPQNSDIPTQLERFCDTLSDYYYLITTSETDVTGRSTLDYRTDVVLSLLEKLNLPENSINVDELVNDIDGITYSPAGEQIKEAILIENQRLIQRMIDSDIVGYKKGFLSNT